LARLLDYVADHFHQLPFDGSNMEKAAAYAISAIIVGFGLWILVAGLSSSAPALWICAIRRDIADRALAIVREIGERLRASSRKNKAQIQRLRQLEDEAQPRG
jgi:hypothetical protein